MKKMMFNARYWVIWAPFILSIITTMLIVKLYDEIYLKGYRDASRDAINAIEEFYHAGDNEYETGN